MRSLSQYGLIGAVFGLWTVLMLMAIALPDYDYYLISLEMYRSITAISGLAYLFGEPSNWLSWVALILAVWLWYLVAGHLHPAFVRLPRAGDTKRLWAWAAWIGGGLLFTAACALVFKVADLGVLRLDNGRADLVMVIAAVVVSALVWLVVSPQAFGRFGRESLPKLNWASVARTAGLGVLFFLVFALIVQALSAVNMVWFTVVVEALDRGTEPSAFGWTWLTIGAVVLAALGSTLVFGMLPAFVPGAGNWRKRIEAARPVLILAGGMLVAGSAALPVLHSVDYLGKKKLTDVAPLAGVQPLSLRLVKFCEDSNCRTRKDPSSAPTLKIGKPITQVSASGSFYGGGFVPLHLDTVPVLEQFVNGKGKDSVLRKSAMMGAADVYRTLWQPNEYYQLIDRFTEQGNMKHGSLLQVQIKLAWLQRAAPITPETRAMLEQLSDDKRYFFGSRGAARLAAAWARFGDIKRAEQFRALARQALPGRYDDMPLTALELSNGRVSGRIAITGSDPAGIRIGLFRVTDDDPTQLKRPVKQEVSARDKKPKFSSTNLAALAGSTVLAADGGFEFHNLGAGDYYLAALIPDAVLNGMERIADRNAPDLISLNARTPRRDLGTIRLAAQN